MAGKGKFPLNSAWTKSPRLGRSSVTTLYKGPLSSSSSDKVLIFTDFFFEGQTTNTGSANITNGDDTLVASGTSGGFPTITGTVAYTNVNDISSISGSPIIVGTLSKTNLADISTSQGSPVIVITGSITNQNDTSSGAGSSGQPSTGTINVSNQSDSCSANGTITSFGSVTFTNTNDSCVAEGNVVITVFGTVSITNQNDTLNAAGSPEQPGASEGTRLPLTGAGAS